MNRFLWLSIFAFFFAGCKSELNVSVKLSQLSGSTYVRMPAQLSIELESCNNTNKSKTSSLSLNELQSKIATLVPKANLVKCQSMKNGHARALFTIPITIGKLNPKQNNYINGMLYALGGSYTITKDNSDTDTDTDTDIIHYQSPPLLLTMSEQTRMMLAAAFNSADKKFEPLMDTRMTIYIENDTEYDVGNMQAFGVYVNNKPYGIKPDIITFPARREIIVKMSNILLDALLSQNEPVQILGFIPTQDIPTIVESQPDAS